MATFSSSTSEDLFQQDLERPPPLAAADASPEVAACSICLDPVVGLAGERSTARLQCGHEFHLDCIGSAFNAKGAMQCPNCGKIENGRWLYANGHHPSSDFGIGDWVTSEANNLISDHITVQVVLCIHELHALDRFEQAFQRKFHEEESVPAARRESVMILHSELKRQRKLVKNLKKKSLWPRTLEEIVEKLVDIVIFLHKQVWDAFSKAGTDLLGSEQVQNQRLGPCGLALHYANIINQIENIVSRPLSLPPSTRDNLYHGLPVTVKSALRSRLQSFI